MTNMKKLLAKIFKKKLYKAEVIMTKEKFTAEYYSDSVNKCLEWILVGLHESVYGQPNDNEFTMTKGVYGKLLPLKVCQVNQGSIKLMTYKEIDHSDYMYMTERMVFIPENILSLAKLEKDSIYK
jgi:hypothetical protein